MKSALIKDCLLVFLMICMSACSGGGKQVSETTVTLKIGAGDTTRKSLFAIPPAIPSIVKNITISITAPDITTISQSIPITSSTQNLVTTFSVPNGTARVITVTGTDNRGNTPYKGISSPLDLTGSDTTVQIQMVEDVKAAITARLLLYFKDTIEPKVTAGTLAVADLDSFYVATATYGLNNGETRDLVMAKDVKDFSTDFLRKTISTILINDPQPDSQNVKYIVTGKGIFSDGSYGFPDDGFVMMKDNGEWKFVGNGYKSDIHFRSGNYKFLGPGATSQQSGLLINVRDPGNVGINSAVVTGAGLTINLMKNTSPYNSNYLVFTSNPCGTAYNDLYCMTDATISSIPANSAFTFTIKDVNNAVIETRTFTLPARPLNSTELTTAHFPTISVPSSYPPLTSTSFDGHYLSDARIGAATGLTISLSKPTAFTPSWLEAHYYHIVWNGIYSDQNRSLLLSDTTTTFLATLLPALTNGASAYVMAEDYDNRREFRTYWQFSGQQPVAPISFFATSNFQNTTGVSEPLSSTVWKFGDPPPIVVWSGLPSPYQLDIYLLADDPTKIQTPAANGNPFPNVGWIKLNPSPIANSFGSGSFTLSGGAETLGVTGSACRILIVEPSMSGSWALSPAFTIGP